MNKCLVCCQPAGRKSSKCVETDVWETVLKVLRTTESEPLGDASRLEKCQLCEICLNFASRCCEIIRVITELQSELDELNGKLRCSFEKSILSEEHVEDACDFVENPVWAEARRSLKTCTGIASTDQIIEVEVCTTWEDDPTYSRRTSLSDGVEKPTKIYEDERLHRRRISDHHPKGTAVEGVLVSSKVSSSGGKSVAQLEKAEKTQKLKHFRTFTVQGFVLKDLEIRVERLTEDFVSKATRRNSQPRTVVSESETVEEGSDVDYNYASDHSAVDSCVEENVASRTTVNEEKRRRQCALCGDQFETHSQFLEHRKEKHPVNGTRVSCAVCGKTYKSEQSLRQHLRFHRPGKYICEICGKVFVKLADQRKHSATHTKEKLYTCELCGKQVIALTPHLRICQEKRASEEEKTFKCSHCNKSFLLQESLRTHETYSHRDRSTETPFQCDVCHQYFKMKCFLVEHRRRAHFPEERLSCTMCSATFVLPKDLHWHMQYEHFGYRDKCSICGFEANTRRAYGRHMLSHKGRQYKCRVCGKKFVSNFQLSRHEKTHQKESACINYQD